MTADAMLGDREKALEAGMDDYISKPVAVKRLADVLRRWVEGEDNSHDAPGEEDRGLATEAVDQARLSELRSLHQPGEPDVLAGLIERFLHEAPSQLAALRAAVTAGDADALKQEAQTLKASASNLGATRMAVLCVEGEAHDPARDHVLAEQTLARLESEFERVQIHFHAELRASVGN